MYAGVSRGVDASSAPAASASTDAANASGSSLPTEIARTPSIFCDHGETSTTRSHLRRWRETEPAANHPERPRHGGPVSPWPRRVRLFLHGCAALAYTCALLEPPHTLPPAEADSANLPATSQKPYFQRCTLSFAKQSARLPDAVRPALAPTSGWPCAVSAHRHDSDCTPPQPIIRRLSL